MSACDALLIYLEVFGYNNSVEKTPNEFEQDIERIRSEFVVAAANKPAALLSQPTEGKPGFLQSVWHRPPAEGALRVSLQPFAAGFRLVVLARAGAQSA